MNSRVYLDHNATTPLAPEVAAAMLPYLDEVYGNPSSLHWAGVPARDAVEAARSQVAALLCCDPTEVVFTSGGTEANNHALYGVFYARSCEVSRPHIITTRIEHPSVLEPCRFLQERGADVTYLAVDCFGQVDPDDVANAIRDETVLISVMHANNEIGTIQPITEVAQVARERGIVCHTDSAQAVGKIPVDVESLEIDLLSIAAHKCYGPKGVGALIVREGVELVPLHRGAGHEAGHRAGTENVAGIVGLGMACELAMRWMETGDMKSLRDYFWDRLRAAFADMVVLNGHPEERLPNTLNVGFRGLVGSDILAQLPFVAASTGAACHAGVQHISPVLAAIGVDEETGLGAVRFSLGRSTTAPDIDLVVQALESVIASANAAAGGSQRTLALQRPLAR